MCFTLFYVPQTFGQNDTLVTKSYEKLREMITSYQGVRKSDALEVSGYYIKKALRDKKTIQQIWGYESLGLAYAYLPEEAGYTEALDNALKIAIDNNLDEEIKRLQGDMAKSYFFFGVWGKSLDLYNKVLLYAREEKDYYKESIILSQISSIKIFAGNKVEALKLSRLALQKSYQIPQESDSLAQIRRTAIRNSHYTLGRVFGELQEADSSLYHIDNALLDIEEKDSCFAKVVYIIQAESYLMDNNMDAADQALQKSSKLCTASDKRYSLIYNVGKGRLYLNQKKYRSSIDLILKGISDHGVDENEEGFMDDIYKDLAKGYKGLGMLDSANYFLEKYINTTSEFDKIKKKVSTTSKKQEVSIFQKELNELAEQKAQKENLLLYGGIAGGAIIIVLGFGLVRSNKQRKKNEEKFEVLLTKVTAANTPKEIIDTKDEVLEEQAASDVNPETTQHILDGLKKLEGQNYFLHPACSAHNVAKRIKTNTTYLSKVINAEFGKNFSTYVNDLRINYAIVKLKQDTQFRNYTISSIATELGYKSADSFTKYFKKDTGLLPSFYIKKLNEAA